MSAFKRPLNFLIELFVKRKRLLAPYSIGNVQSIVFVGASEYRLQFGVVGQDLPPAALEMKGFGGFGGGGASGSCVGHGQGSGNAGGAEEDVSLFLCQLAV